MVLTECVTEKPSIYTRMTIDFSDILSIFHIWHVKWLQNKTVVEIVSESLYHLIQGKWFIA